MSMQHWTNSDNQSVPPWVGQHISYQQQVMQHQYLVLNQGMQQCVPPLIDQLVTYEQQAPMFSHYISSNNPLHPLLLASQPIVMSILGPMLTSDQMLEGEGGFEIIE